MALSRMSDSLRRSPRVSTVERDQCAWTLIHDRALPTQEASCGTDSTPPSRTDVDYSRWCLIRPEASLVRIPLGIVAQRAAQNTSLTQIAAEVANSADWPTTLEFFLELADGTRRPFDLCEAQYQSQDPGMPLNSIAA